MRSPTLLVMAIALTTSLVHAQAPVYKTGDGREIPIQREWEVEADPAQVANVSMEDRPYRFNQRSPKHVATEERAGKKPIYYFRDVRWAQAKDEKSGRHRAYYTTVRVDME